METGGAESKKVNSDKILVIKLDGLGDWVIFQFCLNEVLRNQPVQTIDLIADIGVAEYVNWSTLPVRNCCFLRHRGGLRFKLWKFFRAFRRLSWIYPRGFSQHLGVKSYDLVVVSVWNKRQLEFIRSQILPHITFKRLEVSIPDRYSAIRFRGESERLFLQKAMDASIPKLAYVPIAASINRVFIFARSYKKEKCWRLDLYQSLARRLSQLGYMIELWGGDGTSEFEHSGSLEQLIESLSKSDLYIGNDTGILHIAIQLNKKVFVISNGRMPNSFLTYPPNGLPGISSYTGNIEDIQLDDVLICLQKMLYK